MDLVSSVVGPGGPHDISGVVFDASNGVLLESIYVATIDPDAGARGQKSLLAMQLCGRINQTINNVEVLFIFGTDGAAAIITELLGLLGRTGFDSEQFLHDIVERMIKLREEGNLTPKGIKDETDKS